MMKWPGSAVLILVDRFQPARQSFGDSTRDSPTKLRLPRGLKAHIAKGRPRGPPLSI